MSPQDVIIQSQIEVSIVIGKWLAGGFSFVSKTPSSKEAHTCQNPTHDVEKAIPVATAGIRQPQEPFR